MCIFATIGHRRGIISIALGLAMLGVGCGPVQPPAGSQAGMVLQGTPYSNRAIVSIFSGDHLCTGAFIGRNLVLTAYHCIVGHVASDFTVWDGDIGVGSGNAYAAGAIHAPFGWPYAPQFATPDVALIETLTLFDGPTLQIADQFPTPFNINTYANQTVNVVGFSDNSAQNVSRLIGTMTIAGTTDLRSWGSRPTFLVHPQGNAICHGDSGGPVLLNGKIIGVNSAAATGDDCSLSDGFIAYLIPNGGFQQALDQDLDGITDAVDNCPAVPNADQANCDYADDVLAGYNIQGDACDPDRCVYHGGLSTINAAAQPPFYTKNVKATVFYRAVAGNQHYHDMDAYVCACHDLASPDPHNPVMYDAATCRAVFCKTDGVLSSNPRFDVGWMRMVWQHAYNDTPSGPYDVNPQSCSLATDSDGDGVLNDCDSPVPQRLFRQPYSDAPTLGKNVADWEFYWSTDFRTRSFEWDWRMQGYPHSGPYYPPTDIARVRLWLRDTGYQSNPNYPRMTNYTDVVTLAKGIGTVEVGLLTALESETSILPDPMDRVQSFGTTDPPYALLMKPLSLLRSEPAAQPYLWPTRPEDALTKGMVLARVNPENGELTSMMRSQVLFGDPVYTTDFAAARWPASDAIFAFGGASRSGDLPSRLWLGEPYRDREETIYRWQQLSPASPPAGRAGAMLIADAARSRLILLAGRTARGVTRDAFAFNTRTSSWSTLDNSKSGLPPLEAAGYSHDSSRLYVYGGKSTGGYLDGLYEIDLLSLVGRRIDSGSGPGQRGGAALRYVPRTGTVYLFGGANSQGRLNDLWAFNLARGAWQRIAARGALNAPPPMERASIAISSRDGSVAVLPGKALGGTSQPLWRHRAGVWKTYGQLMSSA